MNRIGAISVFLLLASCGSGKLPVAGGGSGNNASQNSMATQSSAAMSMGSGGGGGGGAVSCNNTTGSAVSNRNNTSHNVGQNCKNCHVTGGSATPMTAAGTIMSGSTGNPNATVKLYTHNTNTLVATLPTDRCGNFYTTATIPGLFVPGGPLVSGVDAVVEDSAGGDHTMSGVVSDGHCNTCHGQSRALINVN